MKFAVLLVIFALVIFAMISSSSIPKPHPLEGMPKHHTSTGFQNDPPHISDRSTGVAFVLKRIWYSINPIKMKIDYKLSEDESLKQLEARLGQNTLTWLGHASFLVRLEGKTILTDPHLTNWAAPFPAVGPLRYTPPGISINNLPVIDMIVISHNHYDHLSKQTLSGLPNKSKIKIVVPLGLKEFFLNIGYTKIYELDWHEAISIDGIQFRALPSVHDSGRKLSDFNKSLWASWLIEANEKKLFFAGDTAYSQTIFKEIGAKHGPIQWALLPIGAYEPQKILKDTHVNPKEAVQIGRDILAEKIVGMHWGTFNLSSEQPDEPPRKFLKAGKELGVAPDSIWIMKIGGTRILQ